MTPDPHPAVEWTPCGEIDLLRFSLLAGVTGFRHAVTTRPWNMAPHRGPESDAAGDRRRRVCETLGLAFDRLTAPEQIHSGHVVALRPSDVGAGRLGRDGAVRFVDGLVCDIPGVPVLQLSADCPLILIVDPGKRAFGTAHASWRGTIAGIAGALVRRLNAVAGCDPADVLAAICPCAGPRRYEVGDDVIRVAEAMLPGAERFFPVGVSGRRCFDLRAANVEQLLAGGIRQDHLAVADLCTIEDERFFSHRREGPDTGRFALIAGFGA